MDATKMLWICTAACFWWTSTCSSPKSLHHFPSFLRSVVDDPDKTAKISGPNGYCITVKDGNYSSGNPIILSPCKTDPGVVEQLWTIGSDSTIQSNGKCMTSSGYSPKSSIIIHDCNISEPNATLWKLENRQILSQANESLAVTALPGTVGTNLTLEVNEFSVFQTWNVSNDTLPDLDLIVNDRDRCIELGDHDVKLARCEEHKVEQQWCVFPDGTIRPEGDRDLCLGYNTNDTRVVPMSCGSAPSRQRWIYTKNDTIWTQGDDLVFTVRKLIPRPIIMVAPYAGSPEQKWTIRKLNKCQPK